MPSAHMSKVCLDSNTVRVILPRRDGLRRRLHRFLGWLFNFCLICNIHFGILPL